MVLDPEFIKSALARLRTHDPKYSLFGALGHEYRLNPPLAESAVVAVERQHGIRLPDDYRAFLTTVGDGGAGPYYGVFKLGEHDHLRGYCSWDEGELIGILAEPFPHVDAWNLPPSFWAEQPDPPPGTPEDVEDALNEAWDARINAVYWAASVVNGAIPISHMGCALRCLLVVSGECRGQVWADNRADYTGLEPMLDASGARHTFSSWYLAWLEEAMAELPPR